MWWGLLHLKLYRRDGTPLTETTHHSSTIKKKTNNPSTHRNMVLFPTPTSTKKESAFLLFQIIFTEIALNKLFYQWLIFFQKQKTECPEETVTWEIESVCIEESTATMLLKDDRVVAAPVKSLLEAFPECIDLERYLVSMCNPTMVVKCTFKGSDLLSMKF